MVEIVKCLHAYEGAKFRVQYINETLLKQVALYEASNA